MISSLNRKHIYIGISFLIGLSLLLVSYFYSSRLCSIIGLLTLFPVITYLFLYKFKWLYYVMIFVLPLSIHLDNIGLGIGISLPGEILLILVLVGVIWRMIFRFDDYKPIVLHPLSLIIFAHLGWMFFSTITSVLITVSLKFLVLRSIYIVVFYVYGAKLFLEEGRLQRFVLMYVCGFFPVIAFTLVNHSLVDFSYASANRTCYPFFNDHTIYAACLAMILPLLFSFMIIQKNKIESFIYIIIFSIALYFSYSRAGLISVIFGTILFVFLYFKTSLKLYFITVFIAVLAGCSFLYFNNPFTKKEVVTERTDLVEMTSSLVDTTNYSNTERLNRWKSAYNMFKERPFLGFGPGTFMFVYSGFQEDETFVSVSDASMGGAHSEYLKPLSEQGVLGLFFVLSIMLFVFYYGQRMSINLDSSERYIVIACVVGLSTYYIHGVFNFFLDTDKASVLFWGLIAYIVTIDVKNKGIKKG